MSEILFRGQIRRHGQRVWMNGEKVPGKWIYGGIFQGSGDFSVIYGAEKEDFTGADIGKFPVYSDTVGQFTGLTDKNGRRIFDGDIVSHEGHRYKVFYYAPFAMWMLEDILRHCGTNGMYTQFREVEVIGNIYDNLEFMMKDQDPVFDTQ